MKLEETNILMFGIDMPKEEVFSPSRFFENNHPVEFEIGCGKGKFLVERASESPETNFIGVDRVGKWMKIGDKRGGKKNLAGADHRRTGANGR